MAANEKEEIAPEAPADESLPTETRDEPKKKTMLLAVIIAVIVVIAAVAAVIGLGLLGGEDEEPANVPPSGGARALTGTTIWPGDSVSFESLAADSDGEIVDYAWMFGDGDMDSGADLNTTSHVYDDAGSYLVYHEVEDDAGATGDNEAQMISVTVMVNWSITSEPIAYMNVDENVVERNTTVEFNMSACAAPNETGVMSYEFIDSMTLDFGDGSAAANITPDEIMTEDHMYVESGQYAAKVNVTSTEFGSSTFFVTIQVLKPESTYEGVIKNPDAFIMVSIGEPDYLDPAIDYETAGGEVSMNVYETLVWYDRESTVDLKPVLATEVPTIDNGLISADGMNYTFNIRSGVTFHDGTDMTAEDVVYSVQRAIRIHDPAGPSWMIEALMTNYLSFYIDGETTVGDWAASESVPQWLIDGAGLTDTDILSEADNQAVAEFMVTQVDSDTVNFRLTKPYPAFIKICAYTLMSVVSMDYVEANGGVVNGELNEVMSEQPCGTGPYMLPDGGWDHGTKIHMVRNDDYWGTAPALKDIYLITATDQNTRILMLQAGDADCISLSIEYESMFQSDPDYEITKGLPTFDMTFAGFNMDINETAAAIYGSDVPSDFFTDSNVRAAFVRMFDADVFLENVMKGNAIQPNGPIPKGMFGYDASIPVYAYDLDEAKAYLQLAENPDAPGQSYWDTGFSIALFYNAGNTYRETACLYIQDALDELTSMAAGDTDAVFTGVVNTLDWPTYLAELRKSPSPFPIFYLGWAPDYADPDNYVTPFLHGVYGTFTHSTGYSNATLDALIQDAAVELDEEQRADMYYAISMAVYGDAPYLWLWQGNNFHIERSWVNGYYHNPMYAGFYYAAFSKG
ncbi:MAG: ABC transporter substrate-binding protein [Thermoplasmata archaeon]